MDEWFPMIIEKNMSFKRLVLECIAAFPDITILTKILRISYSVKQREMYIYWLNEKNCINRKEAILRHFMIHSLIPSGNVGMLNKFCIKIVSNKVDPFF